MQISLNFKKSLQHGWDKFAMTLTLQKSKCQVVLTSELLHFCSLLFLFVERCPAADVHKDLSAVSIKMSSSFQQALNPASKKFTLTRKHSGLRG